MASWVFAQVLLFSHSTRMLDLVQSMLLAAGRYSYLRLDGSTRQDQRQLLADEFNNSPSVFLFLLSTTAGGLGLNLTGANKCALRRTSCLSAYWNTVPDPDARRASIITR